MVVAKVRPDSFQPDGFRVPIPIQPGADRRPVIREIAKKRQIACSQSPPRTTSWRASTGYRARSRTAAAWLSRPFTNIMAVDNQYRWRLNRINKVSSTIWDGLQDDDTWQPWLWRDGGAKDAKLREIDFWVGG